jgi:CBS domain-containing protein
MTEKHIRHIPITDNHHHLLGLVTQRDILAVTGSESEVSSAEANIKLGDVMIRDVSSISNTDSLRQAAMYLQSHKYGCLPVVSDDRLIGIITDSDFIAIAINLLEQVELTEEEIDYEDSMDDVELPELEDEL